MRRGWYEVSVHGVVLVCICVVLRGCIFNTCMDFVLGVAEVRMR